jgi:hypothetical protein
MFSDIKTNGRRPRQIELLGYFLCQEILADPIKSAQATTVGVSKGINPYALARI